MFNFIAKMWDGTVERWECVPASMLKNLQAIYDRPDVFKVSIMLAKQQ
jgi:hypothetical protein